MPAAAPPAYPALSVRDRLLLLALAVATFFAVEGRIWERPFGWDAGILWSYAAVPVLVLLALLFRRRFALLPWLLHSLEIAVGKFGVTAGFLLLLLILTPPGRSPAPVPARPPSAARPPRPIPPLPPPPHERGRIAGRLLQAGSPAPVGTVIFLSAGLPAYAWPVPGDPVALRNDGHGLAPRLAVVQAGQILTAAATDHRLHTLILTQARSPWRLNVPLLADGQPTTLSLGGATGLAEARCLLHGDAERAAWLVILPHPFHGVVGGDGRFTLEGVPPGHFTLTALRPDGTTAETAVTVQADRVAQVDWALPTG